LLDALQHQLARFPRHPLVEAPTRIQRLARLEAVLGTSVRIHVKRDDLTGLGGGGNKLRKLEYLIGAALAEGCDTFLTTGARQSNHARLSAAAAASAGLACELFLTNRVDRSDPAYQHSGNILLDDLFGATIHHLPRDADALAHAHARSAKLAEEGRRAYVVGAGGSSPLGCLGYAACAAEICEAEQSLGMYFAEIVVPNGSSGTHAGLAAGLAAAGDDPQRLLSFTVLDTVEVAQAQTRDLAGRALTLLGADLPLTTDSIRIDGTQRGADYGVPTTAMLAAVRLLARSEGLLLDPVYSGKAFAGLLHAIADGRWAAGTDVLFVMTGGTPGLFAYQPALASNQT
jgi:L-cysteate sulfo-lyase